LKVAEQIAKWLADAGYRTIFCVSGGASLHLIHAIADEPRLKFVCPQSEQAASFMADASARLTGFGCALATSGPGATNLITGIAASYYDSVPCLFLTGNQTRQRLNTHGTRQYGFQATPIVDLVKPITKYAACVDDEGAVLAELATATTIAKMGRPGPVLLDFPDDVQRAEC
jgi:acetolactate synthase-1/2/3 large subunit